MKKIICFFAHSTTAQTAIYLNSGVTIMDAPSGTYLTVIQHLKRMSKKRLFIYFALISQLCSYSQNNLNLGTYITKDKLGYIVIYPNNTFGYVSFMDTSPFLESKKKESYIKGFMIHEQGAGFYNCDKKYINLEFTDVNNPIDSLKIETKPVNADSITITIAPIYNTNWLGKSELTITNKDINLDLWTSEEISFKVPKDKIPLKLNTNFQSELIINDKNDYLIKVYINSFRTRNNINLKSKKFKLNKLKRLKKNTSYNIG